MGRGQQRAKPGQGSSETGNGWKTELPVHPWLSVPSGAQTGEGGADLQRNQGTAVVSARPSSLRKSLETLWPYLILPQKVGLTRSHSEAAPSSSREAVTKLLVL